MRASPHRAMASWRLAVEVVHVGDVVDGGGEVVETNNVVCAVAQQPRFVEVQRRQVGRVPVMWHS